MVETVQVLFLGQGCGTLLSALLLVFPNVLLIDEGDRVRTVFSIRLEELVLRVGSLFIFLATIDTDGAHLLVKLVKFLLELFAERLDKLKVNLTDFFHKLVHFLV